MRRPSTCSSMWIGSPSEIRAPLLRAIWAKGHGPLSTVAPNQPRRFRAVLSHRLNRSDEQRRTRDERLIHTVKLAEGLDTAANAQRCVPLFQRDFVAPDTTRPAMIAGLVRNCVVSRSAHPGGLGGLMDTGVRAFLRPTTMIGSRSNAARASTKSGEKELCRICNIGRSALC